MTCTRPDFVVQAMGQQSGDVLTPERHEIVEGLKLTAVAVVCAVVCATVVIGAGGALLPRLQDPPTASAEPVLIRASN